jgi:hypothetical protein
MTDMQALLAGLGRAEREELYETAARYAEYCFYRGLGKLPAHLDRTLLETFERIDADSSAQRAMQALWAHKVQDGRAWIDLPSARSGSQNPAELLLKGPRDRDADEPA